VNQRRCEDGLWPRPRLRRLRGWLRGVRQELRWLRTIVAGSLALRPSAGNRGTRGGFLPDERAAGTGEILLIHPGYSLARHYNNYEIVSSYLRKYAGYRTAALVCNRVTLGCSFAPPVSVNRKLSNSVRQRLMCRACTNRLIARVGTFCDRLIFETDYVQGADKRDVVAFLGGFPVRLGWDDYRSAMFRDYPVGQIAVETFQRQTYVGRVPEVRFEPGSLAYEFLRAAVMNVLVAEHIFAANDFQAVLSNEMSYVSWAPFCHVALRRGIPVIHQLHTEHLGSGVDHVAVQVRRKTSDLMRDGRAPSESQFRSFLAHREGFEERRARGQRYLEERRRAGRTGMATAAIRDHLRIEERSKVVGVFTHLCWDSSATYGRNLFASFEDWLTFTYKTAVKNDRVVWAFKIHPSEARFGVNPAYNTTVLLESLMDEDPRSHVRLIDATAPFTLYDMCELLHAGITAGGTVSMELPAFRVPCVSVNAGIHSGYGFTHDCLSVSDYERVLLSIDSLPPVNDDQQVLAACYASFHFDPREYLNVAPIFEQSDLSDGAVALFRLSEFLRRPETRAYFERHLSLKLSSA